MKINLEINTDIPKNEKLKSGGVNRHVYYFCTKSHNIDCRNKYINEQNLLKELTNMIDEVELDALGVRERIKRELERYNKFRVGILGSKKEARRVNELDIRNHAKYILKEGTLFEK